MAMKDHATHFRLRVLGLRSQALGSRLQVSGRSANVGRMQYAPRPNRRRRQASKTTVATCWPRLPPGAALTPCNCAWCRRRCSPLARARWSSWSRPKNSASTAANFTSEVLSQTAMAGAATVTLLSTYVGKEISRVWKPGTPQLPSISSGGLAVLGLWVGAVGVGGTWLLQRRRRAAKTE